jgi:mannose-6-phosphate isomerase-like protein (cupin superfamily)
LKIHIFCPESGSEVTVHMNCVIEGTGIRVNEKGEEQPLKAGVFPLFTPDEKQQFRNKGVKPFKMICGVPREFEGAYVCF